MSDHDSEENGFHCLHHEVRITNHVLPAVWLKLRLWQTTLMQADIKVAELLAMSVLLAIGGCEAQGSSTCSAIPQHAPSHYRAWSDQGKGR